MATGQIFYAFNSLSPLEIWVELLSPLKIKIVILKEKAIYVEPHI